MSATPNGPAAPEPKTCPQCGAPLSAEAPDAPCSVCLMRLGLESWVSQAGDPSNAPTEASAEPFDAPSIEELQPHFPQFQFIRLLGRGGMGAVYLATQKTLDRPVAIKIIHPRAAADPGFAARFAREARSLARLNHPNIVGVHDFGEVSVEDERSAQKLYYIVMQYVDGVNLRELLREKRLTPKETLHLVPPICDALQYAHDTGVVHRDIKPENILVDKHGQIKIADFGLAKLTGGTRSDATLTGELQAMGTLHYMAPEQMERPAEVDHRADIYALGVTLYELLTGVLPLGRFAPPSSKVQVDVRLDEIVLRALEREPQRRYQQVSDVKTDVESLDTPPPHPVRHPDSEFDAQRASRDFAFLFLGTLIVFVAKYMVLDDARTWLPVFPTCGVIWIAVVASLRGARVAQQRFVLRSLLALAIALVVVMPWAVDHLHQALRLGNPGDDEPIFLRVALCIFAAWVWVELMSIGNAPVDAAGPERSSGNRWSLLQRAAATWLALPRLLRLAVRLMIGIGFFACGIQFLSFGAERRPDLFVYHLGRPDRWFSLEVTSSGYQWNLNLATSLLLGLAAWGLGELDGWLGKIEGKRTWSSAWIAVLFGFTLSFTSGLALLGLSLTMSSTPDGSEAMSILRRAIFLMGVIETTGLAIIGWSLFHIFKSSRRADAAEGAKQKPTGGQGRLRALVNRAVRMGHCRCFGRDRRNASADNPRGAP